MDIDENAQLLSFLEMKTKVDPAFKSMTRFYTPRDVSYVGLIGEKGIYPNKFV